MITPAAGRGPDESVDEQGHPGGGRNGAGQVEAARLARWPGGTIRNEAEVYSGYYTEAASVLQPIYARDDDQTI